MALERPDSVTASAASARDEIGRAVAAKIREAQGAAELSVMAEEVLPEIEKFLESPAEKRLRRIRAGIIMSSIGVGTALGISLVSIISSEEGLFFLASLGLIAFFIGVGLILNGVFLTVPRSALPDRSSDADRQRELDLPPHTNDLALPESANVFSSVTEHTTRHLKENEPTRRDRS
jgi:hypothetical protein